VDGTCIKSVAMLALALSCNLAAIILYKANIQVLSFKMEQQLDSQTGSLAQA
jgi:hypothetical protein